jgi:hypothetical protein
MILNLLIVLMISTFPAWANKMTTLSQAFPQIKAQDLEMVDKALKNYGHLGQVPWAKIEHDRGIEFYLIDHNVKIEEKSKEFQLGIFPKKGLWEFNASVIKASGKLENPVMGTIEPSP